jgi:hypothetical protein
MSEPGLAGCIIGLAIQSPAPVRLLVLPATTIHSMAGTTLDFIPG